MQRAKKITEELNDAMHFIEPKQYHPVDETLDYSASTKLQWWAHSANYFQLALVVNGQQYTTNYTLTDDNVDPSIPLSQFGINWKSLLQNTTEPLVVKWKITSAVVDTTGLIKPLMGNNYIAGAENFITLPGYTNFTKESDWKSFSLNPIAPPVQITITDPASGTTINENQTTVTATVTATPGQQTSYTIQKVGFIVNGVVQYATLDGDSFSATAVLTTGDNVIKAGVLLGDGSVYISSPVTITSDALNNQYHIQITWDKDNTDVDLHFLWGGREDCYYGDKTPSWGDAEHSPKLDVDDTDGYGPENITIQALPGPGHYKIWVYYYSDHDNGGTNVTAHIYKDGISIYSSSKYMTDGQDWVLFDFDI